MFLVEASIVDKLASIVVVSGIFSTLIVSLYKARIENHSSIITSTTMAAQALSSAASTLVDPLKTQLSECHRVLSEKEEEINKLRNRN